LTETEDTPKTNDAADPVSTESAETQAPAETDQAKGGDPPASEDPLTKALADATKYKDAWMRTAADFDNFRKRSRRELDDARKAGREELLKELLPTFDNLERAIVASKSATDVKGVTDGITMILKQFESTLGRVNITKVATVGSMFDPQVHEAIQQIETNDHPPGTVVAEVQPGYLNGERLVRAAMVVVAKPKSAEAN
jgi:molecular chaperone GrpE